MLLFRSEQDIEAWCRARDRRSGSIFSVETCWRLGVDWYAGRLSPDWRRRSIPELNALFRKHGLLPPFWEL
jgi:hypothetical protein